MPRYARNGDVSLAYDVFGEGERDILVTFGWIGSFQSAYEHPAHTRWLRRLGTFGRVIMWDKRGTGLSERVPPDRLPTLEERMDDMRVVMDAAGSERAVALGISEGASLSTVFAATHPDRVASLILIGGFARMQKDEDYPWGASLEEMDVLQPAHGRELGRQRRPPQAVGADHRRRPGRPGALESHDGVRWHTRHGGRLAGDGARHRCPGDASGDRSANARAPSRRRPHRAGPARPLPRGAHPGRPLRRAAGLRPPLVGRRRRHPRRGRILPHRQHHRVRAGPRARHGDVHRHRRLHHASRSAGRPALARARGVARPDGAQPAAALPRPRGEDARGRLPRHLRRSRSSDPVRHRAAATRCARSASRCAPASTRARSS